MSELITTAAAQGRADLEEAVPAAVVDEHRVRAAAGLTMAAGGVAFAYAYFRQLYWPLQAVSSLFAVEFLVRVTGGLRRSPFGRMVSVTRLPPSNSCDRCCAGRRCDRDSSARPGDTVPHFVRDVRSGRPPVPAAPTTLARRAGGPRTGRMSLTLQSWKRHKR